MLKTKVINTENSSLPNYLHFTDFSAVKVINIYYVWMAEIPYNRVLLYISSLPRIQ